MVEKMREEEKRKESIFVISQFFYGNRTGTEIKRENIDYFLHGYLGDCIPERIKDVNRKTVKVPGSENIVIVYDQTQEDRYINVEFPEIYAREEKRYLKDGGEELKIHVSCEIPELGFKIHTRCIACRIDENGVLQSLEDGDGEKFIAYFPIK